MKHRPREATERTFQPVRTKARNTFSKLREQEIIENKRGEEREKKIRQGRQGVSVTFSLQVL